MPRTGLVAQRFSKPQACLLKASSEEMSEVKTSEDLSRDITFDGENISEWFRFDRQVLRRAKKLYGKYGDKLWNGTTTPIDDQTVNSIAQDTYDVILKNDGIREANSNWDWDWFWTVQYQTTWRADALETIVLYVESRCTGKAFKFITELTTDQWPEIRALMQREFARATPAKIKQMEQAFTSGLPSSPGAVAFPHGVDIRAKNYALEQARLTLWRRWWFRTFDGDVALA